MSGPSKKAKDIQDKGLVIVYTGDGKGKTTAALGMVFRALGRGKKVGVVQFIKGKWKTGERELAAQLPGLHFATMGEGFTWESQDLTIDKAAARAAWEKARGLIDSGDHFLVVLDEITYTFHHDFLGLDEVLEALKSRPSHVNVVLTGRRAPDGLVRIADLVTEMRKVKHPFDEGWPAKPGVDF